MKLFVLTVVFAPMAIFGQSQQCPLETATLNGAYSMTVSGTAGSPVWAPFTGPVATIGKIVFDGLGNLQIPFTTIVAATPPLNVKPPVTIRGTYTIGRDCTGTMTLIFTPMPNAHYNLIISLDGRQITMIATDSGDVLTGAAQRLDHH
jgi:hypothetical protein